MFARRRRVLEPSMAGTALIATAVGLALLAVYLPGSADPQPAAAAAGGDLIPAPASAPSAAPPLAAAPQAAKTRASALTPGQKPPQFVVLSFDGAGSIDRWKYYRDIAKDTGTGLTFYLSGTYLLPTDKAKTYRPPNFPVGYSEIGYGGDDAEVRSRMEQIYAAYGEGHEMGTHYNGHMCGAKGVAAFSGSDWADELEQWYGFVENWRTNADAMDAPALPFGREAIIGGRTPCLEGKRSAFLPVLEDKGFAYDTSGWGYLQWPRKTETTNLWDIPLQVLNMSGTGRQVLSMDYNFYELQGKVTTPASRERMNQQMLSTYRNAFDAVYAGTRAPLVIGHHFAEWNLGVYHDSMGQFIRETCGKPDVRCVTFRELVEWLDAQDSVELARLRALGIQKMKY